MDEGNLEDVYEPKRGTSDRDENVRLSNVRVSVGAFKQQVKTMIGGDLMCSTLMVCTKERTIR